MGSIDLAKRGEGDSWFSAPHLLLFMLLWAMVHALLLVSRQAELPLDTQVDPDGYMRLVRVGILLEGGGWFDGTIPRSNWPYGEVHHWTRPLDVLIILLALPLRAFLEADAALALAGMLVSPFLHLGLCIASVWIVRPLVTGPARFFAMPAMLVQLGILLYSQAGRADHHTLIFLLAGLALGAWIRALLNPRDLSAATLAGVFAGLGIWVSLESLLPLALLFASGAAAWILGGRQFLGPNRRLCLALTGAIAIAMALERHPSAWLEISFDRISLAHLTMSLLALGYWWVMGLARSVTSGPADTPGDEPIAGAAEGGWGYRFLLGGAGALVVSGLLGLLHPQFFRGPWVDVDPRIVDVWLAHVRELQPLLPRAIADLGPFVMHLGPAFFLVPLLVRCLWQEWRTPWRPVWILLLLSLLVYVPLTSYQLRFSAYAGMVFAILMVEAVRRLISWANSMGQTGLLSLARAGAMVTVLMAHLVVGGCIIMGTQEPSEPETEDDTGKDQEECSLSRLAPVLSDPEGLGVRPMTIATFIGFGPELLYRTPHRVLGGPYHRNYQGVLGAYRLLTSSDDQELKALAEEREVDLILLCPPRDRFYFGREGDQALYKRLLLEKGPAWIRSIPLPPEAPDGFLLFRVEREAHDSPG